VIGHRFDDIAPCNTIRQARCPVLLAHGTEDATVPTGDAERIYANRRDERVSLFLMPGSHDEYGELTQAMAAMTGFLNAATDAVSLLKNAPANGACSAALQGVIDIKKENSRMSQESTWSNRYRDAGEAYLFGTEPNRFLAHRVELLQSGRTALSVADGEGRNSVWLAEQGLDVTAIEISAVAIEKARRLALGRKVEVSFQLADMLAPGWPPAELHNAFDWVVGIFIQFVGPEWRDRQFDTMKQLTRPGGRILLQGYTVKQLEYRTGGPSAAENLYTEDILRDAFADWEIEELVEYEEDITEGTGHKGRSALIGLVARKPD
jgi:SAM-dependent methyltransferase